MTVVVTHSTPSDSSFSTTGAAAWDASHSLAGVGTMAEQNANAVAITGGSVNSTTVGATTASTGAFTTLSASSTVSGTGFSTYLASPPAIGGTTAAAGTFTTLIGGSGSANYEQITGGATGKAVQFQSLGTDANISQVFQSKGTGAIDLAAGSSGVNISNGGTVTAITRTAAGSNYTSFPTWTASAPTTAGGTTASGSPSIMIANAATIQVGGTGYTLNDVVTLVGGTASVIGTFTVTAVSGGVVTAVSSLNFGTYSVLPSNPVSTTGGTGTGLTLNVTWAMGTTFTITNAGSGYVEQPTVSFSGGGGSGATAYATVGAEPTIRSLFGGATTSGLAVATSGGTQVKFVDVGDGTRPIHLFGGSAGAAQAGGIYQPISVANMAYSTNTGSHIFYTGGRSVAAQMFITNTTSAVNYVQVTGAATGGTPSISAQGSDAAVSLNFISKSTGVIRFYTATASSEQFRVTHTAGTIVNYATATGAIAGAGPIFGVAGTDADIDITLTPKGAGAVRFGTYTGTILTPTGYITIKDSGGTSRRLLVG